VSRRALAALVLTCLLAGVVLMIGFETPLTRALGVACLFAFVAAGLFLIVDPVLLSDESDPIVDRFAHGATPTRARHGQQGPECRRS
jgi:hypothetical protein